MGMGDRHGRRPPDCTAQGRRQPHARARRSDRAQRCAAREARGARARADDEPRAAPRARRRSGPRRDLVRPHADRVDPLDSLDAEGPLRRDARVSRQTRLARALHDEGHDQRAGELRLRRRGRLRGEGRRRDGARAARHRDLRQLAALREQAHRVPEHARERLAEHRSRSHGLPRGDRRRVPVRSLGRLPARSPDDVLQAAVRRRLLRPVGARERPHVPRVHGGRHRRPARGRRRTGSST